MYILYIIYYTCMYVCMYVHTYMYIHVNGQYSRMRVYASSGIARKRAVNIHPESRSKSGQISIFLLPPHDRVTLGGTFVPCRPEGAAVLGKHLQFVRSRCIIKEVRSLLVPKQHLPLKTSFSATSSSTTRAALRWCFPSSSRLSVSPVAPSSHRLCLWLISQRVASAVCSKRTDQQLIAILDGRPIQICFGPEEMLLCC
jgi:hypothetical protein